METVGRPGTRAGPAQSARACRGGRFLIATYPKFIGLAQCGAFKTLAEAQAYARSMAPNAQQISSGTVVNTGWAYKPVN